MLGLRKLACLLFGVPLLGCTSNMSGFSDKVSVDPIREHSGEYRFVQSQGVFQSSAAANISWFSCTQDPKAGTFVLLNPGNLSWSKDNSCTSHLAKEALEKGLNVLALQRPQDEQLGDDRSLLSLRETVESLSREDRKLEGLWAEGEASLLALRLARVYPWEFLVIGNGIYDLEKTKQESKDQKFLELLQKFAANHMAEFIEKRSAAWDLAGLPKRVFLYHGSQVRLSSVEQASAFKSSLAASEYQVDLYILEEDGDQIRPEYQRAIISKILAARKP